MDLIALRHTGELDTSATTVRIMAQDKATELIEKGLPGDTLHKVPEALCNNALAVFALLELQLQDSEYVRIP